MGAAASATLSTSMSSIDTTFTLSTATNWPTGAVGPFFVVIDPGTGTEEKVLCSSRSTTTVTVAGSGRGADSTIAQAHSSGAVCYPCWTATEADELNAHANASTAVHGVAGAVVGTTDAQALTNKTIASSSNTITVTGGAIDTVLAGKQASGTYIAALTGDITATGPGSAAATLPTVNANVGSFGSASSVMTQTVNAKGLTTAAASVPILITEAQVSNLGPDLAALQPLDADLTALAAMTATVGLVARTGAGAFTQRTITSADGSLTVTAGNGSANPSLILTDSGSVTAGFAAATGFTLTTGVGRLLGGTIAMIYLNVSRSGATINADAGGNFTDTNAATIPAAFTPNRDHQFIFRGPGYSGGARVKADGTVQITDITVNGGTVANGDSLFISATYFVSL